MSDISKSEKQNENIAVNVIGYERVSSRPGGPAEGSIFIT